MSFAHAEAILESRDLKQMLITPKLFGVSRFNKLYVILHKHSSLTMYLTR